MKVVHVVGRIDAEASGPSYSVPRLCDGLHNLNIEVNLHAMGHRPEGFQRQYSVDVHPKWSVFDRFWGSKELKRSLRSLAPVSDIVHNHGLWTLGNIYPSQAVRDTPCLLVTSPRGTLAPDAMERQKWAKRTMWRLGQKKTILNAACLHATSKDECDDIRRMGFRQPVAIIPNGIDIPAAEVNAAVSAPPGLRQLLFLSRIHPHKGVDLLLRAWATLENDFANWELCLAGPDETSYGAEMKKLCASLGVRRVRFLGARFGEAKSAQYREADLFILPTRSENFGMAVAEALAHCVPVIVTKGAPWRELEMQRAGWWVDRDHASLVTSLRSAMSLPNEELKEMGRNGRKWMDEEFSWEMIAARMQGTYHWLLKGGVKPDWIAT